MAILDTTFLIDWMQCQTFRPRSGTSRGKLLIDGKRASANPGPFGNQCATYQATAGWEPQTATQLLSQLPRRALPLFRFTAQFVRMPLLENDLETSAHDRIAFRFMYDVHCPPFVYFVCFVVTQSVDLG